MFPRMNLISLRGVFNTMTKMNLMKTWFEGFEDAKIWASMNLKYTTGYGKQYAMPANHGFSKEICIQGARK